MKIQFNIDGGNNRTFVAPFALASCSLEPPFLITKARLLHWGRALILRRNNPPTAASNQAVYPAGEIFRH